MSRDNQATGGWINISSDVYFYRKFADESNIVPGGSGSKSERAAAERDRENKNQIKRGSVYCFRARYTT
jgi:hypothetical protein